MLYCAVVIAMAKDESQLGEDRALVSEDTGFSLGTRQRWVSGIVGLGALSFGAYLGFSGEPAELAIVMAGGGFLFLFFGLVGRVGRFGTKIAGQEFSYDPGYVPSQPPQQGEAISPVPALGDGEAEAEADLASTAEEVGDKERDPFLDAIEAWREGNHKGFDSKMQEAVAAAESEDAKVALEAMRLAWMYNSGEGARLADLEALKRRHPESHYPVVRLGECHETVQDYAKAALVYAEGAESPQISREGRRLLLSREAKALAKANRFEDAEKRLNGALQQAQGDSERAELEKFLADLYETWGKKDLFYLHLEKSLEMNPADVETRFRLAYSYADGGLDLLALYHYRILESQRGGPWELNNLGLIYSSLDLPITMATCYRRAIAQKNTLAAANLARKAAGAGLATEARGILDRALKEEKVDEAVHSAMSWLGSAESDETKRISRIEDAAKLDRALLLKRVATELDMKTAVAPNDIVGVWETTMGQITFERRDSKLVGKFREKGFWDWELSGDIRARTYFFEWTNNRSSQNREGDGLLIFTEANRFEGVIRHTPGKGEVRNVTGKKVPPPPPKDLESLARSARLRNPAFEALLKTMQERTKESRPNGPAPDE